LNMGTVTRVMKRAMNRVETRVIILLSYICAIG